MKQSIIIKDSLKPIALVTPIMTREKFAEHTGLSADTVRGMMDRRHLQVIKLGRRILVNLAAMTWKDIPTLHSPVVTIDYLAEHSGLTYDCIEEQYYRHNIPGEKIGKRIMIDLVELTTKCMKQAQPEFAA